jgi:hypothetical protein
MFWVFAESWGGSSKHDSLGPALRMAAQLGAAAYVADIERDIFIIPHQLGPAGTWRVSFVNSETGPSVAVSWTTEALMTHWVDLDGLVIPEGCPTPDCGGDLWPLMRIPRAIDPSLERVEAGYACQCHECLGWMTVAGAWESVCAVATPYIRTRRARDLT